MHQAVFVVAWGVTEAFVAGRRPGTKPRLVASARRSGARAGGLRQRERPHRNEAALEALLLRQPLESRIVVTKADAAGLEFEVPPRRPPDGLAVLELFVRHGLVLAFFACFATYGVLTLEMTTALAPLLVLWALPLATVFFDFLRTARDVAVKPNSTLFFAMNTAQETWSLRVSSAFSPWTSATSGSLKGLQRCDQLDGRCVLVEHQVGLKKHDLHADLDGGERAWLCALISAWLEPPKKTAWTGIWRRRREQYRVF